MTSRERVKKTIAFENTGRLPYDLPEQFGSDILLVNMKNSPDERYGNGVDEWGAKWENIGENHLGEVTDFPIKDWADFESLIIPDITDPEKWNEIKNFRKRAGDKFVLAQGISIYERVHFLRGLDNTWMDIYMNVENLCKLIDILVEMNLYTISKYKNAGVDGYLFSDDWGLQDRLMISPDIWREIWKPRYKKIFDACHEAGISTFLHSCGYIVDILDDLIEIGLDVIHMDQQENMGLQLLGERFGGRINFYSPVDIQYTMVNGSMDEIRSYCQNMVKHLSTPTGGFIPRWYTDPIGAGHSQEAIDTMSKEFLKLSAQA